MININNIYNENNIDTMNKMSEHFIDGIITSPPYNVTTKRRDGYYNNGYSEIDNLKEEEYLNIRLNEFKEFQRILKPKGVICYNISYHNENPILPILLISKIHENTNLTLADIITWKKSTSIPFQSSHNKLSRICENIYIIVNKEHLKDFEANKIVSKINDRTGQIFYKAYYNFIIAKNNDRIKSKLKASYSTELVQKLIDIYFKENSLIYDPFMGIGTTAKGCISKKCNFIGSELDNEIYEQSIKLI